MKVTKKQKEVFEEISNKLKYGTDEEQSIAIKILDSVIKCMEEKDKPKASSSNDDFDDTSVPYRVVTKEMKKK